MLKLSSSISVENEEPKSEHHVRFVEPVDPLIAVKITDDSAVEEKFVHDSDSIPIDDQGDHPHVLSIDTDFHPENALLRTKTSAQLLDTASQAAAAHTEMVSSFISQLKSGDIRTRKPTEFRTRRLTYSQKTKDEPEPKTPEKQMMRRTTVYASTEIGVRQEKVAPFSASVLGTYSCHGIEPDPDEEDGIHEKTNQDRGCVVYPFHANSGHEEALFVVLDGHGEQGDRVAEFVMRQVTSIPAPYLKLLLL